MNRCTTPLVALCGSALALAPLQGQILLGAHAASLTHTEITETFRANGRGWGPVIEMRDGRFHVHGTALRAHLSRSDASFYLTQADVHAGVLVAPLLALEVGLTRRWIDRNFAGQDLAAASIGVYSETRLSRMATVRLRGAYIPFAAFRGGGRHGPSIAIGVGSTILSGGGDWRAQLDFSLQRFDREVPGEARPIQTSVARLGIARRWNPM